MTGPFDYFVVFAEMRTGSNFLETNLNAFESVTCFGEAFNPHFIGYPNTSEILGVTQSVRDADPDRLITAFQDLPGRMAGFRYFHDHDPRVLEIVLGDPRCAKIILTRNPLDSYVSWKIAQSTGQWKLTDVKRRKEAKVVFDGAEFLDHLQRLQSFQVTVLNRLQASGQTAFYVAYEDLQDVDVMNGMARWLGLSDQIDALDKSLKRQNPASVRSKVSNTEEMAEALAALDGFNLARTPNFEPRRGAAVPSYVGCAKTALLYLPVRGGPEGSVRRWMASLDGVSDEELVTKMTQKHLRQWKRANRNHRSFTVLRHPVDRIHAVFCERILTTGPGSYLKIRETLRRQLNLPIPKDEPGESYSRADHRAAFQAFLEFVGANLAGQTAIRIDSAWGTQSQTLGNFGEFVLPDFVLRESELVDMLPSLARQVGHIDPVRYEPAAPTAPFRVADIYDDEIEDLVSDVYNRDYLMFGFDRWAAG